MHCLDGLLQARPLEVVKVALDFGATIYSDSSHSLDQFGGRPKAAFIQLFWRAAEGRHRARSA